VRTGGQNPGTIPQYGGASLHPKRGWYHNDYTGYYHNMYGQATMSEGSFTSNTPFVSSPEYSRTATPWEVKGAYGTLTGTNTSYIGGPDPLGNREMLFEYASGKSHKIIKGN